MTKENYASRFYLAKLSLLFGAAFMLFSVIIGAFAAHALKAKLDAYSLDIIQTGVTYQAHHGLALILAGILSRYQFISVGLIRFSISLFILGTLLFSGSLYALALTGVKSLGIITPIGGVGFILGWIGLIIATLKISKDAFNSH